MFSNPTTGTGFTQCGTCRGPACSLVLLLNSVMNESLSVGLRPNGSILENMQRCFRWFIVFPLCLPRRRSLQGNLPSGPWVHLLALRCSDFCQTLGRRWCAKHRCVVGGAKSRLPSDPILPVAVIRTSASQTPTDSADTL